MLSTLSYEQLLKNTREYLKKQYFTDQRPWVVAFSGGKDSTFLLQLVYEMLIELKEESNKPVFVVYTDTGVEPPNIKEYLDETLTQIASHAEAHGLPLKVKIINPKPEDNFWVKLIGKGYPSPTRLFRWCTSYLKIRPARRMIEEIVREYGSSVILLLGSRKAESSRRKQSMESREHNIRGLNPHHEIPDALVASPIADWSTDDVWDYLLHNSPPWRDNHEFMKKLYLQASGDECPFILDQLSPSCGGSRFGCWVCTVVKKDLSMQGFIRSGEEWMRPLNEFRNWLKEIREDNQMRMNKRRNNSEGIGPFTPEARKLIFKKLLEIERKVGINLISDEEISYIQVEWSRDFDLGESAFELANHFGRGIKRMADMELRPKEQEIIDSLLADYELPPELIKNLLYLVTKKYPLLEHWSRDKGRLEKDIADALEKSLRQEELTDSTHAA